MAWAWRAVAVSSHAASHKVERYGGLLRAPAVLLVLLALAALLLPWLAPALPRALVALMPGSTPRAPDVSVIDLPSVQTDWGVLPVQPRRTAPALPERMAEAGRPKRLVVQSLSVRSAVVPISGQSGTLLPPSNPRLLGWWREGPVPGAAQGTAVMTGHTVSTGGGAFDHLRRLVPGDRLLVGTARGTIAYRVLSTRIYTNAGLARNSKDVFRLDGPARVVLVTCSDFDGTVYRTKTVVVAAPVGQERPVAPPGPGTGGRPAVR